MMWTLNAGRRTTKSRGLAALMTLCTALLVPRTGFAHPMGNFSINHYSRLVAAARAVEIDYIIDMAEIPTFQEMQEDGLVTRLSDPALMKYLTRQAELMKARLTLEVDGHRLPLECYSRRAIFPPGAGGLPTMKMGFIYRAQLLDSLAAAPARLHYRDDNFPGRAGWKEIIAIGRPGVVLSDSSVPSRDRSVELTNYPMDMLHSPPQTLEAAVMFKAAPPGSDSGESVARASWLAPAAIRLEANRQGTPRSAFTDLIKSDRMDLAFLLTAAFIAALLGAFHALEPGHGKTLVAAYLVGSRGTARQAVLLGATVTASHTASVYALGIVTLYASRWVVPEQLYPWLGATSGLIVAGLGCTLLIRRWHRSDLVQGLAHEPAAVEHHHESSDHHHEHDHSHSHQVSEGLYEHPLEQVHRHNWWGGHIEESESGGTGTHSHPHAHAHGHNVHVHHHHHDASETPDRPISLKSLFALGVTGGIVPCPAALVVLLAALAIHRVAFGLFLIVAFSAGLAALLIALGLATVFASRFMSRFAARGRLIERWLPLASSGAIMVIGLTISLQSLVTAGVLHIRM